MGVKSISPVRESPSIPLGKNPVAHRAMPGTSMAAPHVTGIAALVAQETGLRGLPLYQELRNRVLNIGGDPRDIGHGFIRV